MKMVSTPADLKLILAALEQNDVQHEVHVYPEVGHGFMGRAHPTEARDDAFKQAWAFFHKHLETPPNDYVEKLLMFADGVGTPVSSATRAAYAQKRVAMESDGTLASYLRHAKAGDLFLAILKYGSVPTFPVIEDGNVIGFVKESVNQTNSVVVAIALSREPHEFWFPLGDVEVGMPGDRRKVAALENLMTGERYPVEWGGIRLRIDPVRDPALLFRCLA